MYRHAHILGLMSVAVAAFGVTVGNETKTTAIMAGLLAAAAIATVIFEKRAASAPRAAGTAVASKGSALQTKRMLMLMMVIGIVVYGGGAGTFSSFSAETVNTNSQTSSGTLTMSDTTLNGTVCYSASSTSSAITADNINDLPSQQQLGGQNTTTQKGACDQVLNITNIAPGVFAGYGSVSVANTGSIDAQKLKMFAPYVNTALATALSSFANNGSGLTSTLSTGSAITSLAVSALARAVTTNQVVKLDDGSGHTQTFTASAPASIGATSISVTSQVPNFAYPSGTTAVKTANAVTSLTVLPIEGPIKPGDTIELDYAGHSQQVTAANSGYGSGAVANWTSPLGTTLNVTSFTPDLDYPAGTRITDVTTDGLTGLNQQNIDCFDVRNSQNLNFNYGGGLQSAEQNTTYHWITDSTLSYTGPLCASLGFWVQEQTVVNGSTYNYCWYGDGAPSTTHTTNAGGTSLGMCRAPITGTFSTLPPYSVGFLPTTTTPGTINLQTALSGNVVASTGTGGAIQATGDTITISQLGVANVTCTAAADAYIGSTTISVKSCSNDGTVFTNAGGAPTIVDTTTLQDMSTDTQTVANFQTLHGQNNEMEMPTLVAQGTKAASGANVFGVELGKSGAVGSSNGTVGSAPATRKFYFGIYLPSGTASFQNSFQDIKSTFGVGFHIDQF